MYDVHLARRAQRYYRRVDRVTAQRLDECFEDLKRDPFGSTRIRPLQGYPNAFRYRVGGLRVLYTVDQSFRIVTVNSIRPRGDAY